MSEFDAKFVPLPDLKYHTEDFDVGSLGLPVGFQLDRLVFNLPAISASMKWADIGHLSVTAGSGEVSSVGYEINGVDAGGAATGVAKKVLSKAEISQTEADRTEFFTLSNFTELFYKTPDARVHINASEKEARILAKPKKWPKGPHDPGAQAHYINSAIRRGIKQAAFQQHFNSSMLLATIGPAAGYAALLASHAEFLPAALVVMPGMSLVDSTTAAMLDGSDFKDRRWSYFYGPPLDRHALAIMHSQRKLVKSL